MSHKAYVHCLILYVLLICRTKTLVVGGGFKVPLVLVPSFGPSDAVQTMVPLY